MKTRQSYFAIRLGVCILAAGITLFAYIEKQNELTELRLAIPMLGRSVKSLQEENTRLIYEIEQFESPIHLMELMKKPEFSHLKYPFLVDEVFLPAGGALSELRDHYGDAPREKG